MGWLEWFFTAEEGEQRELTIEELDDLYNEAMGDHGQG